jgi:tRNA A-37 threonylcarbamoyl transferase component Bud32
VIAEPPAERVSRHRTPRECGADSDGNTDTNADMSVLRRELQLSTSDRVEYEDEGWDSRVYIVNGGEAVFKFPRSDRVIDQYRTEVAVLRLLESQQLPVDVPRLRWLDPELRYVGYEGIRGRRLSDVLDSLGAEEKQRAGEMVGRFVLRLHALDLPGARVVDLDAEIANYVEKFNLSEDVLRARLSATEFTVVSDFFTDELPAELRRFGTDLKLCHGDLGPWNIITSTASTPDGGIGVIDFGDAGYWDASKDFSGRDPDFLRAALDSYGADDGLRAKAELRSRAFPVLDMPFYIGKGRDDGVEMCLDDVRRVLLARGT